MQYVTSDRSWARKRSHKPRVSRDLGPQESLQLGHSVDVYVFFLMLLLRSRL